MKTRTIRSRPNSRYAMRLITSVVVAVVGFIIALPFVIDTFILEHNYHYFGIWQVLGLIGFVLGAPMFFGGIISLFVRNNTPGSSNTTNIDIARIRYQVETDSRRDQ